MLAGAAVFNDLADTIAETVEGLFVGYSLIDFPLREWRGDWEAAGQPDAEERDRKQNALALEILFDPFNTAHIRLHNSLYGPVVEFYSVEVVNNGPVTLYDVTVRALDSWFTREVIALTVRGSGGEHSPVDIFKTPTLHPGAPEIVELFGGSYNSGASSPDYMLNKVQRFTLEVSARDTAAIRREFE